VPDQIFVSGCASKLEANALFAALVRKTWADLPRYADRRDEADMAQCGFPLVTSPGAARDDDARRKVTGSRSF